MLVVIVGVAIGIWALLDYLSYKEVTFTLSLETKSISVYSNDPDSEAGADMKAVASREGSGPLRLKPGHYYVLPVGDGIIDNPIQADVNDSTKELSIKPYYTSEYLFTHYSSELGSIRTVINEKYQSLIGNYAVADGTFYHYGGWYTTTLRNTAPSGASGVDTYGIVLRKEGSQWSIVATPAIIFAYNDYKNIPADVLYGINKALSSL